MAFKILRKNTKEYDDLIAKMRQEQLFLETRRWQNLTQDKKSFKEIVDHFQEVRAKFLAGDPKEATVIGLSKLIRKHNANIAKVQGNLEIDRISQIISSLPPEKGESFIDD